MRQQFQPWTRQGDEKAWLLTLIEAMEQVSRPEMPAARCGGRVSAALTRKLAQPASPNPDDISRFGLRN